MFIVEDVIRRRLLIDGDGTGDDRRLNVLLKTLIKWCNTTDEKPEDRLELRICILNYNYKVLLMYIILNIIGC